jgi:hypothetical protein
MITLVEEVPFPKVGLYNDYLYDIVECNMLSIELKGAASEPIFR